MVEYAATIPTLADLLRERVRSRPEESAAICGEYRLTYADLGERVIRLANVLEAFGIDSQCRVLWLGRNCHRLLESILACGELGAVFCPANWRNSAAELEFVIRDSEPAVVLWEGNALGKTVDATRKLVRDIPITWIQHDGGGDLGYEPLIQSVAGSRATSTAGGMLPALMIYTAAFDGRPNGALLTHANLVSHNLVMQFAHTITHETICLNCAPLYHIGGLYHMLTTLQAGGCNVFVPQADPRMICEAVERERCTTAYLVEATVEKIVELNSESQYDLRSLRTRSFNATWDSFVTLDDSPRGRHPTAYGQTELSGLVVLSCLGGIGAHGRPIPTAQVRIVDDDGNDVPIGGYGEIVVRGPTVMLGYHNRPALNAERFQDGWYRTSDRALREPDGSITFIGSMARLIKSGKENIYPREVEVCLLEHGSVAECAVIGVPDPVFEQAVKAIVVLRPGAVVNENELIEHCRSRLASYKKPRSVVFAQSLPRTATGIDYAAVDGAYGGGGYPGTAVTRART